jgi:hypothetical protein
MHWKMSIDLSRPQVPCMGQHDPLDGFLTYNELEMTVITVFASSLRPGLDTEIAEMAGICRTMNLITDDPLATGGLLADASRIASLMVKGNARFAGLLERVMEAALQGTAAFGESDTLRLPAGYRLAFRELGLSIGLNGTILLEELIRTNPAVFSERRTLHAMAATLTTYMPLEKTIERFWTDGRNRAAGTWQEHIGINQVMLATSLAPGGFLTL